MVLSLLREYLLSHLLGEHLESFDFHLATRAGSPANTPSTQGLTAEPALASIRGRHGCTCGVTENVEK